MGRILLLLLTIFVLKFNLIYCALQVNNTDDTSMDSDDFSKDLNDTIMEIFWSCKCVLYYQCDSHNYLIVDGSGILDERSLADNEDSFMELQCTKERYKCCGIRPNSGTDESIVIDKSVSIFQTTNPPLSTTEVNHVMNENNWTNSDSEESTCGLQKLTNFIQTRIKSSDSNGEATDGEIPWIVSIFYQQKGSGTFEYKCSGSLVHPQVVMSAVHCLNRDVSVENLRIVANGKKQLPKLSPFRDSDPQTERKVKTLILHPEYQIHWHYNDIALLILTEPFDFNVPSNLANSICLPENEESYFYGKRCWIAGWGDHTELQKVDVPIVSSRTCQNLLRNTILGRLFILHESFLCAGGEEGKDACKGDGGGPLMCDIDGRYYQVGIVAWGVGCGRRNVPGVYVNVPHLMPWIRSTLKDQKILI